MENKKIFISGIDTKLGFHVVEYFRDDHLELENYSYLVGSSQSTGHDKNINTAVHAIINFQKEPALLGKCVLESDVIVLDLRNATDEAEYIIKLIQWKTKEKKEEANGRLSLQDELNKKYVIIGIGSFMTWAHQKPNLAKLQGNDKEQALAKFLSFDYQKQEKISENDRNKRITHHSWTRERQIEKSLLALNKKSCVRSCVLTAGLFYGKDFPSVEIENMVAKCFSLNEEVCVYGQGNNYMPTVHIDDFCEHLDITLKMLETKSIVNPMHLISVDESLSTQQQMVETLLRCSGFIKEIKKKQLTYLTKQEAIHSWSVPLLRSSIFNKSPTKSKSFCSYFRQQFSEITEHVELQNYHYVLYSQEMEPQCFQQLDTYLTGLIQVFRQEDLTAQISKLKSSPKQEVDIHEVSRAIEQGFLKLHNQQSYVLILNQILLDVEVVKKYNLKKFELEEVPEILRPKFKSSDDTQVLLQSQNNINDQGEVLLPQKPAIKEKESMEVEKQQKSDKEEDALTKKNKKYAQKVDQYLLDNVVCYLSQAFLEVKLKKDPKLSDFVSALKTIYSRQAKVYDEQIKI